MSIKATTKIKEASLEEAKSLIHEFHYLGKKGFRKSIIFGLYNPECVGVAVFHGLSAPETAVGAFGLERNEQENLFELGRLVLKPEYNGGNYGSYLIGGAIKALKKNGVRAIISYADSTLHDGGIYRACNFKYCGMTTPKKDFYVNGKKKERGKTKGIEGEWLPRPRKHRYVYMLDKTLDLKWELEV